MPRRRLSDPSSPGASADPTWGPDAPTAEQARARLAALDPASLALVQWVSAFFLPVTVPMLRRVDPAPDLEARLSRLVADGLLFHPGRDERRYAGHPHFAESALHIAGDTGAIESLLRVTSGLLEAPFPGSRHGRRPLYSRRASEVWMRALRVALHLGDTDFYDRAEDQCSSFVRYQDPDTIFDTEESWVRPFDAAWFDRVPASFAYDRAIALLGEFVPFVGDVDALCCHLAATLRRFSAEQQEALLPLVASQLVPRGRFAEVRALVHDRTDLPSALVQAWLCLLEGRPAEAVTLYEEAFRTHGRSRTPSPEALATLSGCFYPAALILDRRGARHAQAIALLEKVRRMGAWIADEVRVLLAMARLFEGRPREAQTFRGLDLEALESPTSWALAAILIFAGDRDLARQRLPMFDSLLRDAVSGAWTWVAAELAAVVADLDPSPERELEASTLRARVGVPPLLDLVQVAPAWERTLGAMERIAGAASSRSAPGAPSAPVRLVWHLAYSDSRGVTGLVAREQRRGASGVWSVGRPLSLKRLWEDHEQLDYLTDEDRRVRRHIRVDSGHYFARERHVIDLDGAVAALAGHPRVFKADEPRVRIDIVKGRPTLHVTEANGSLALALRPDPPEAPRMRVVVREGPATLRVVEFTREDRDLHDLLGACSRFPGAARDRLLGLVASLAASLPVHSDVPGVAATAIPADATLHVDVAPAGGGFDVEVRVYPAGDPGPSHAPGEGPRVVLTDRDGLRVEAERDLRAEGRALRALVKACPALEGAATRIRDLEACLELLEQLDGVRESGVVVGWPRGGRLEIRRGRFRGRLSVAAERDWFSAGAEVELDDGWVLEMSDLLEALGESRHRFLPLGDGHFLALTARVRQRLEDLRAFTDVDGSGARVHPLAAPVVDEILRELGDVEVDRAFRAHLERLSAPADVPLPSTFQAELRDYQREGFAWLGRISTLGLGGCLADDMGLGKTVQTLGILVARAPGGPALVVAPTSVCQNWIDEAARFAPTLRVRLFSGPDREAELEGLGPFDVLVASYTLLQASADALAGRRFHSVVLDEAQAIKNAETRRSKAAMALRADFRLATTGTPVENHLGELWNLFRFLNPGLLGSHARFQARFGGPIERDGDPVARARLKRLVSPFILRRTKAGVLEELPPRTEITLHVELSQEERALYEAARRRAVSNLAGVDAARGEGAIQVLAEIMRLRRACCHPRLVLPESTVAGSKLEAFGELVDELVDNRHKALVFSQFVDHLQIVREYLDGRGIVYQYLDGSTPAADRARRVAEFQAGRGDLFLISLRAGGTGLNLTAADYVIHLDPWWNPAVEDQASDRAHRIGQERPVTVYRLVARDTIEDLIVDLHQHKRALADCILEGTDTAARLSPEELLKLLREPR